MDMNVNEEKVKERACCTCKHLLCRRENGNVQLICVLTTKDVTYEKGAADNCPLDEIEGLFFESGYRR